MSRRPITPYESERIRTLIRAGLSVPQIAVRLSRHKQTIYDAIENPVTKPQIGAAAQSTMPFKTTKIPESYCPGCEGIITQTPCVLCTARGIAPAAPRVIRPRRLVGTGASAAAGSGIRECAAFDERLRARGGRSS